MPITEYKLPETGANTEQTEPKPPGPGNNLESIPYIKLHRKLHTLPFLDKLVCVEISDTRN